MKFVRDKIKAQFWGVKILTYFRGLEKVKLYI